MYARVTVYAYDPSEGTMDELAPKPDVQDI